MKSDIRYLTYALFFFFGVAPAAAQTVEQNRCVNYQSAVFAQRENVVVTHADVHAFLEARVPQGQRKAFLESPDRVAEMLETLLSTYAMAERAIDSGILSDPVDSAGLYITMAREQASRYRETHLNSNRLEDYESAARELYLKDRSQFNHSVSYDLFHLLIEENESRNSADKMKRALEVYDRLKAGGSFDEVAQSIESEDTQNQDIELNDVRLEELVRPLRGVIRDAEGGQLLAPVRSQYGWHIVRVESVNPGMERTWEEARPMAIRAAKQRHEGQVLERLRKDIQGQETQLADGAVATLLERFDVEWSDTSNDNEVLEHSNSD